MEKICGIYKISNCINNKVYIGQSVNIYARWAAHLYSGTELNNVPIRSDYNNKLHTAMRKLGINNFYIEIIEKITPNKLNEREKYWINYYKSNIDDFGYNMTIGGSNVQGENNPRSILTKEDVVVIRTLYDNRVPFREVYELYENIISKRGLQKVWHYETWLNVMPEVYTEENKLWHKTKAKGFSQKNIKGNEERKIDEETIQNIKIDFSKGIPVTKISKKYKVAYSTAYKYAHNQESEKPTNGISIKNIETGKIFSSYTKAAEWASTSRKTIAKCVDTKKSAGIVPESKVPATWTTNLY